MDNDSQNRSQELLCEAINAAILIADQQSQFMVGALLSEARDAASCGENQVNWSTSRIVSN